jgi:hypothetical protein
VLAPALAVALAGEGAVAGPRPPELAGGQRHVDDRQDVVDALDVLLQAAPVGDPAAPGAAPQVGDPLDLARVHPADVPDALGGVGGHGVAHRLPADRVLCDEALVGEPVAHDDVQHAVVEGRVGARPHPHVLVGGAGHGRLARVDHDQLGAPVPGAPEVLHEDREALGDVGPRGHDDLGFQQVGPRVAGPVDAEGLLVGRRRRHHAQAPVVVEVAGAQGHAGELAHQVGLLGGHAGPAEDPEGVAPVGVLDAPHLAGDAVQGGLPGHRAQGPVPPVAHERGEQPVGVVDLLVGHDPFGAQPHLVDVVVAGLDADDAAFADPQEHAALHAAEAAVGGDQLLAGRGRLPPGGRLAARLAAEVAGARRHDRVARTLGSRSASPGAHRNPRLTWSR